MEFETGEIKVGWKPMEDDDKIYDIKSLMKIIVRVLMLIEQENNIIDYSNVKMITYRSQDTGDIEVQLKVKVGRITDGEEDDEEDDDE